MEVIQNHHPKATSISRYGIYLRYFQDYLKNRDFKSLWAALRYVLMKQVPSKGYFAQSEMGKFFIRGNTNDFQYINRTYEKAIRDYLENNIDSFDVFIDLGACIGEYCIWLAGKGKTCIAVEPINYEALKKNIELNGLQQKIHAFHCGVGSRKERVYFEVPGYLIGSSHIDRSSSHEPNVDIDTLDSIVSKAGIDTSSRVIIKMDVEGMEPEVITGGVKFINSVKDLRIIYEHFPEDNYRNDKSLREIGSFIFNDIDAANRIATKQD